MQDRVVSCAALSAFLIINFILLSAPHFCNVICFYLNTIINPHRHGLGEFAQFSRAAHPQGFLPHEENVSGTAGLNLFVILFMLFVQKRQLVRKIIQAPVLPYLRDNVS